MLDAVVDVLELVVIVDVLTLVVDVGVDVLTVLVVVVVVILSCRCVVEVDELFAFEILITKNEPPTNNTTRTTTTTIAINTFFHKGNRSLSSPKLTTISHEKISILFTDFPFELIESLRFLI